jgi:biopolymer transport protein ExbD
LEKRLINISTFSAALPEWKPMHDQLKVKLTRVVFAFVLTALVAIASFARMPVNPPQDTLLTAPTALIVEINARGNVTLNDVAYGTVADAAKLTARLNEIFAARTRNLVYADRDGATMTQFPLGERIAKRLYVQPDAALPLRSLLKFLIALATTDTNRLSVNVRRGDLSHEILIERPGTAASSQTNAHYLLVQMEANRALSLNAQTQASIQALGERLTAIFTARRQNRDFTPGTSSVNQSVWLQLDQSLSLSDVLDLLVGISPSYARPVYLRLDSVPRVYQDAPPKPQPAKPTRHRSRRA